MTKRISVDDYLMGREKEFPGECTAIIMDNAAITVERVNALLAVLEADGVDVEINAATKTIVSSGWRPVAVNARTPGSAPRSRHMSAEACDVYDPDGLIDEYLMSEAGQRALVSLRLWLEHPSATKGWSHVQTVPPRSGRRVFFP